MKSGSVTAAEMTKTFRSRSQLVGGVGTAVVGLGLGVGSAISARGPGFAVAWVLTGVLCAVMGLRLASARVCIDEAAVHVHNFFSSFDLKWDDVQKFEMGRWGAFPSVCLIRLRAGRSEHAFGLQESTNFPNGSAQSMVDQLNDELAGRRSSSSAARGSAQADLFDAR
jgi:hypothetical protein